MESSNQNNNDIVNIGNIGHQINTTNTNRLYTRNIHSQNPDIMQPNNAYSPLLQGISMISLNGNNKINNHSQHTQNRNKWKIKSVKKFNKWKKGKNKNGIKHDKNMSMNIKRNNYILHQRKRKKQNSMKIKHFLNINDKNKTKSNKMNRSSYKLSSILFGDNSVLNINNMEISGKDYQKHINLKNSKINLLKHQIKKKKMKQFENVTSPSIFKLHGRIHHCDLKSFQCDICHSKFMHWNQLKEHIQTHSMPLLSI